MSKTTTIILVVAVLAFLFLSGPSSSARPATPYMRDPWAQPPPAPNYGAGPPSSPTTSSVLTTLIATAGQAYHDYLGAQQGVDDYEEFANSLPT